MSNMTAFVKTEKQFLTAGDIRAFLQVVPDSAQVNMYQEEDRDSTKYPYPRVMKLFASWDLPAS